ncbi:hypothetical protein KOW79_005464 [Hemibagrus wyckioides]|uniref:Poly [ADP-ribose] polymerase n=1 Tax=Hemibagrus wyckioides TaxID=337641 RepID=A0A9D3NYV7_9TELE|nr:hypothetical protein KOW79_005464 [Hemibagrus wyckioides]
MLLVSCKCNSAPEASQGNAFTFDFFAPSCDPRSSFLCLTKGKSWKITKEGKFQCTAQIHNVEDGAASSFSHSKANIVPEIRYHKQISKNLKVSVWKDDLTTHKVDAVVNAANEYLSHGAGLALALSQAGGRVIQETSKEIIKQVGKVPTGKVVATPAGNLPCKMVIHAVGPCVSKGATSRELQEASALLEKTIVNILRKAEYDSMQSVAIPAISSGIFNFPLSKCADIIATTVKDCSEKRMPGARTLEVRLVNNDSPSVHQMERACCQFLGSSDPLPKKNQVNAKTQSPFPSLDLGNVTLCLKKDAIENETSDVIVDTIGQDLNLSSGQVSCALLKKAGQKMQEEIKQFKHGLASEGDIIATSGFYLSCKEVYHIVCSTTKWVKQILQSGIKKCLWKASSDGYTSISFPALGTGNLGLRKDEVSQIMTGAVQDFAETYTGPKIQIFFVIFPKDTDTLKAFEKKIDSTSTRLQNSRSPNGKSPGFHDSPDIRKEPAVEIIAPSPEALREAKMWLYKILHIHSGCVQINNNNIMHLSQKDHERLMSLQHDYNVVITEFFKEGRGGIIINGESVGVHCAAVEVEAMLCQAQEDFAHSEEKEMLGDLDNLGQGQQIDRMSNKLYKKTPLIEWDKKDKMKFFEKFKLRVVKVEKIENPVLKELFDLNCKRIQAQPKRLYQCVNAQFCDLTCRVGFQREYAPPKAQRGGAGIYFTSDLRKVTSLWPENEEEYLYIIEAQVLTGTDTHGSPDLIVPPPIGRDPLVCYDSVTDGRDTHIIFNGQQAYPEFLITCTKQGKESYI